MRLLANRDCLTCDFCGNIHVPEANADGVRVFDLATGLNCSICATPLVHAAVAGLRIQHCTRCKGLLIPMDSMLAIVTHLRGRFYVIAEYPDSNWVENLRADPEVNVRVGNKQFAGKARLLPKEQNRELVAEVQALSAKKYGWGDGLIVEILPAT